ncbi:glycine cleavage system protein H [Acidipropionibacterium jensenii]|uniref:glycine cleavage system protein GcvH n=1 Tax=Acidipropionibacterium jensenii TaxID=1749 RepID=UPI000BC32BDB|nr:glycine cleavage system protein GcvH [Acidipropionibacterium jensenii]AZZ41806.1 glycine cleavage system protein H [Acidipropionibacterium jensenii]
MTRDDLLYSKEHEWLSTDGTGTATVGITDYATQELGDVVFVSLPQVGQQVSAGTAIGEVESTKSVSDLFSPVSGTVTEVNEKLAEAPELVNSDPFGQGWLFKVEYTEEPTDLLGRQEYLALTVD